MFLEFNLDPPTFFSSLALFHQEPFLLFYFFFSSFSPKSPNKGARCWADPCQRPPYRRWGSVGDPPTTCTSEGVLLQSDNPCGTPRSHPRAHSQHPCWTSAPAWPRTASLCESTKSAHGVNLDAGEDRDNWAKLNELDEKIAWNFALLRRFP